MVIHLKQLRCFLLSLWFSTESLSDSLGRVILDTQHEEVRRRIRKAHSSTSGDHLVAGLKGLGFGLVGGVTSVFKQTYEGVATEGLPVSATLVVSS